MQMTKSALRSKYKRLRSQLDEETIQSKSLVLANRLLSLPIWDYTTYHLFLSIKEQKEIDTEFILHILQGKDKNIVVPKSDFNTRTLKNYLLTDNTLLKTNSYNIPEPVDGVQIKSDQIEVVFVPLLAFDIKGNRIGYGKGFYDRFLATCDNKVLKIGLSFFDAEKELIDIENSDIRLDYCVTPDKTYMFK
ncbi:5-formyltetrahydrofolate cyclo-ligase [Aquimarina sp. W85]|uniref:5-formyltetrahydrofolate cyclo-ligase n=1 Tax=Aquimarina rhodophyticola TaxID=3342246 RepID=UPI00366C790E